MIEVAPDRFEELVGHALDRIPPRLQRLMDNLIVVVEDHPPPGEEDLLGLYEGIPLTERDDYGGFAMPDKVTIYRIPILELAQSEQEVVDEVHITVIHEIAHHFGIDDDRLEELGWD